MKPKISIITAVLNNPKGLLKTIESIQSQSYKDIEYIIIDGGSHQDTINVIKNNKNTITRWISEPDKGISDAFNKGIQLATGEYICFLGAGDVFYTNQSLMNVFDKMTSEELNYYDILAGKIQRVTFSGKALWSAPNNIKNFNKKNLLFRLVLPHQGMFMHKRYFEQYGLFDLNIKYSMDYEMLLRSYHHFPKIKLIDEIVANWVEGGIGTGKMLEIYQEYHQIKLKNKIAPVFILNLINFWIKLKYKVKSIWM